MSDLVRSLLDRVPPNRLLVATDFDGTLAPIVERPDEARPLPGAEEALRRLRAAVARVAIITGRAEDDVRRRLDVEGVAVLGDYGRPPPSAADREALREFNSRAEAAVSRWPGVRLEAKPGSTSVHYRENPAAGPELLAELAPLASRLGLDARDGKRVVEVLPAGWDKSRALAGLMEEERVAGAVYCGDDTGDRRCFELLAASPLPHLAIGVRGADVPDDLFGACDAVLEGPRECLSLLSELAAESERRLTRPPRP